MPQTAKEDILRAAWVMAVGALGLALGNATYTGLGGADLPAAPWVALDQSANPAPTLEMGEDDATPDFSCWVLSDHLPGT